MNELKCSDLKCVQKPTRGRLSLTHLPVGLQPLRMVRESV